MVTPPPRSVLSTGEGVGRNIQHQSMCANTAIRCTPKQETWKFTDLTALLEAAAASVCVKGIRGCQTLRQSSSSHHQSPGGERCRKRPQSAVYLARMGKGCFQSYQCGNCYKGNIGETSETRWSAYGLSWTLRFHLESNWSVIICTQMHRIILLADWHMHVKELELNGCLIYICEWGCHVRWFCVLTSEDFHHITLVLCEMTLYAQ